MLTAQPEKKNKLLQSSLVKNSAWGIIANILQIVFVCLFFAIVARKYHPDEFARFLISNTVYQIVAAFSSMGLGQWFIRQYVLEDNKLSFTSKFLKMQAGLGLLFMVVNILLALVIYPDAQIRILCFILGTNIIFDNFINAIKTLNIAEGEQKKTAVILVADGFLKLLVGCLLFIYPLSTVVLSVLMIVVRLLTVSLFIKVGSSNSISLKLLWQAQIVWEDVKQLVVKNWQFMVIGSISIIYWKIGNIIISKQLSLANVADYEIAFRIFSVLQIVPVVAASTVYPQFIKYYNEGRQADLKGFFHKVFMLYTAFAVLSYAFIYAFSGLIVPLAFGNNYPGAALCMQQMFLTFLLLPTVILQANIIVAIGLEKLDMWFNLLSLVINVIGCLIGLHLYKELYIVNYSIFISFFAFHVLQDVSLIRRKIMTVSHCLLFYVILLGTIVSCWYFSSMMNPYLFFVCFAAILTLVFMLYAFGQKRLNAGGLINEIKL
ncbi:oligosaccharide flippase family protein [Mucilaginibacter sp. PAMB04274]|uniref:oligosaccharide flippase family protein n=1 Tax=Mucilaginibacter sp. PAMB04274 TaxID=3138568 RepID=UPI0031F68AA9